MKITFKTVKNKEDQVMLNRPIHIKVCMFGNEVCTYVRKCGHSKENIKPKSGGMRKYTYILVYGLTNQKLK